MLRMTKSTILAMCTACCVTVCIIIFEVLTLEPSTVSTIYPNRSFIAPARHSNKASESYNSPCSSTNLPVIIKKDTFQMVTNTLYIYSAYHDHTQPDRITIIGICQPIPRLTCQLWYKENNTTCMNMKIHNDSVAERLDLPHFPPCLIYCRLPDKRTPFAVSLVNGKGDKAAKNVMEVTSIGSAKYTRNFTMCVSPFHHNFSDPERFVEWIEFNRILGADHFILYNFTHSNNMYKAIKHYEGKGLVEIHQWPLPMTPGGPMPKFFGYFGQKHALTDCLYRCKNNSKFVVITDYDEFLVPHAEGDITWYDMLKKMPEADGYLFRHCFFPLKNPSNDVEYSEKEVALKYKIRSLLTLQRYGYIFPHGPRGKYIVRTNVSTSLETHRALGIRFYLVKPYIGLLHHYRVDRNPPRQRGSFLEDKTVLEKYGGVLTKRIVNAWSKIGVL